MNVQKALEILADARIADSIDLPVIIRAEIVDLLENSKARGMAELYPNMEGLVYLLRVLVLGMQPGTTSFLEGRLDFLEESIRGFRAAGDPDSARACQRLGIVIARALEIHMSNQGGEFEVPEIFRSETPFVPT